MARIVITQIQMLKVSAPGPQGPPGPQGLPGVGDFYFRHDQMTPAASILVTHNLGNYPAVTLIRPDGVVENADVDHISVNQLTVTFPEPWSGTVICS